MRPPGEIRRQLLGIRDRNMVTTPAIAERARVSTNQLKSALRLEATEDTLRKLDAFLDAPALHKRERADLQIDYLIDTLQRELFKRFKITIYSMEGIRKWPYDKKRTYYNALNRKGKFLLQRQYVEIHQLTVRVPDGATFWQYEKNCFQRLRRETAIRARHGNPARIPRANPGR